MDQNQIKKRQRATNFNSLEVRLLTELVTKYRSVIENKKTDAVTNKEKDAAWSKLATTFNAASSEAVRTAKTLKLKYESLKKETKKKTTLHRQELYKTGGGPSTAPDFNDVDEKVLAICSNISGLNARNDSDNIADLAQPVECVTPTKNVVLPNQSANIIYIEDGMVEETIDLNVNQGLHVDESFHLNNSNEKDGIKDLNVNQGLHVDESFHLNNNNDKDGIKDPHNKWGTWNPKSLRSKVSQELRPNKASVTAKLDQLTAARLELVKLQLEIAKKEHLFIEEEHNRKMLNLQNDEVRKEQLHQLMLSLMQQKHS